MKTTKILILLLFAIQLLSSCYWQNKENIKETKYIPEEMKPYIMFPEGSWWVYEDTINGLIDSFYLQKQTIEMEYVSEFQMEYERLRQEFFVNNYQNNISRANTSLAYYNSSIILQYRNYFGTYFSTEYELSESIYFGYIHHIDSISFYDKIYNNIKVCSDGSDSTFWCKDIGIVKYYVRYTDTTQSSFILKKYNINN